MKTTISKAFTPLLMSWNKNINQRKMPWKGIKDPYKIWLSEIILQQTRVEQGLKYYEEFTKYYPTVGHLALAPEEDVFRMWQGLGYYNRCRNMIATATNVHENFQGKFPGDYDTILSLKGIGEYTAAAISSFAFDLPYAVVDGNVVRVLSRVFMLDTNYFEAQGKKEIQRLAQTLLDKADPASYNQAIMDLGATICKPQNPLCGECPFQRICKAFLNDRIAFYPIKKVRNVLKKRSLHFLVFDTGTHFYLTKRTANDIWKDLYTFYCIETEKLSQKALPHFLSMRKLGKPIILSQILSHQKITGYFYLIPIKKNLTMHDPVLIQAKKTTLNKFAFPKLIRSFFENYEYL